MARPSTQPTPATGKISALIRTVAGRLPMSIGLGAVATVWALGCVWSFTEQRNFATAKAFGDPALLPLVIDGLAAAMAGVAYAASLDGRPAVPARLGTALAVIASAVSNGTWATERTSAGGLGPAAGPDPAAVVIAVGIPVAANVAFEVLLSEMRRQVQRSRGLPAPTPLPTLRLVRLLLDPVRAFSEWRGAVLAVTAPSVITGGPESAEGADRVRDLARRLERGEEPSGSSVAHELGASERTGRRLLSKAHDLLAASTRHDSTHADSTHAVSTRDGGALALHAVRES